MILTVQNIDPLSKIKMLVAIFVMLQIYDRYKSYHFKNNAYFALFCCSAVYLIQWLYYV